MLKTPNGMTEVYKTFGDPRGRQSEWAAENVISVHCPFPLRYRDNPSKPWSPVTHIQLHKLVAESFTAVQNDIWNYARLAVKKQKGYDHTSPEYDVWTMQWLRARGLDEFSGSYVVRPIRGTTSTPSLHGLAIALDLDSEDNPRQKKLVTIYSDWFLDIWRRHGWLWGGDFRVTKDPMHFQYATGC